MQHHSPRQDDYSTMATGAPPPTSTAAHSDSLSGPRRTLSERVPSPALHRGGADGERGIGLSGQGGADAEAAAAPGGATLTRRVNTLSTTGRMVRLERNRARLALQGVGLSEEDQEFYVPPSPVRGGPYSTWTDHGHADPATSSASGAPASSASTAEAAWKRAEQQEQLQPAFSTALASSPPSAPVVSAAPEAKRSSFVVVRGGKGDQALTERKSHQPHSSVSSASAVSPPPTAYPSSPAQLARSADTSPQDQPLRHKNSLKPFLEQERQQQGGRDVEDWERGLIDERKSGAEGPGGVSEDDWQHDPYSTLKTPPLSANSFPTQLSSPFTSAGSSFHTTQPRRGNTTDPWLPPSSAAAIPSLAGANEDPALVRRHQSLKSFRRQRETSIEQTLSSSPASSAGWPTEGASVLSDDGHQPRQLGSLALASASTISGFGTRVRSGTSPAPLALQHSHSLNYGPSTSSPSLAGARLTHSNSLSSAPAGATGLHHSNSLGSRSDSGATRVLSPVVSAFGGAKSPWSPTEEETKQLGMNTSFGSSGAPGGGSGSLSRGGSSSSRGSRSHSGDGFSGGPPVYPGGRAADEVRSLDDALGAMQLGTLSASPGPLGAASVDRNSPSPNALPGQQQQQQGPGRRLPSLMTTGETLGAAFGARQGPASAAAFVPPIGHSHFPHHQLDGISEYGPLPTQNGVAPTAYPHEQAQQQLHQPGSQGPSPIPAQNGFAAYDSSARGTMTAVPGPIANDWHRQKEFLVGGATPTAANPGPFSSAAPGAGEPGANGWQSQAAINQMHQQQQQISALQAQMQQALSAMDAMRAQGAVLPANFDLGGALRVVTNGVGGPAASGNAAAGGDLPAETPIDINSLVQKKGYNPPVFDLHPKNARFFVIKSYTEEDVHKSLKYEIWASTDLGNKRLDRAFRESADKGPIYLFFSVNGSGHFAGMAQMLTPVDYSMSSNVWASDKWKGVLKVRWIYIKDVPLAALRHIRLSNTPENKPVTSSRDTQEVPYDAGLEVLRIIASYQSRTSLLQDYAWYEAQFRRNQQVAGEGQGVSAGDPNLPQPPPHYAPSSSPQPPQQGAEVNKSPRQQAGGRRFWNRGGGPGQNGAPVGPPRGGGLPGAPPPVPQIPPQYAMHQHQPPSVSQQPVSQQPYYPPAAF